MLDAFLHHRREVVTRRTIYDLRKARERAHTLEGLAIALANIDEVIALIKASPALAEARVALMGRAWPAGAVPNMLARAGAAVSRPEGLDAALGLKDGFYDLRKARERAHTLEGLAIALANIDEVIALIKASPALAEARVALMGRAWPAGAVPNMLARAGAAVSRPEGLDAALGLKDGFYRL